MRKLLLIFSVFLTTNSAIWGLDTLRIGVEHEPPFVIKGDNQQFSGLCIDLWKSIVHQHQVAYQYIEYPDHLSLIRALDFGEIDLSINPIHVSELRLKMLDVTQPFFVSTIGVAGSQQEEGQISAFIRNFFSLDFFRVVLLLILVMFVFGTVLWLAERKHNRRQFRPGFIGLFDGLWWSAVTMTTVGYGDKAPKSRIGRIIAMIWMFTAIIIISGFTAAIASTLTVNSLQRDIEDIDDLRNAKDIGSVYASSSEEFLRKNDIEIDQLYDGPEQSLRALANNKIDILVYDKAVLEYFIDQLDISNKVDILPINFNQQYRSFFLPKDSPHLQWINPILVRKINEQSWPTLLQKYNLQKE
jgi:ABC-type amino acid transport substrate-binding protein